MECNKIPFDTEQEARKELVRIIETDNFKPWLKRDKKPSRVYLCDCGHWHLTSTLTYYNY